MNALKKIRSELLFSCVDNFAQYSLHKVSDYHVFGLKKKLSALLPCILHTWSK